MSDGSGIPPGAITALLRELVAEPSPPSSPPLSAGQRVGKFEIVRELGRGGFGVVYEARDGELGRAVALKLVRVGDGSATQEEQLLREAEAAARLSHPNVVVLHDLGRCERGPYLVMELLRGVPLSRRLGAGALPVREAVRVAHEVAAAIAHAHAHGVVHRDLTPGNVFLCDDGRVKVLDFGLARAFGHACLAAGTPAYMPPEQRHGAPADARTDVFALGVMLHRMIAGELPFGADGERAGPPPALRVAEAPALEGLVARMLAPDPAQRPRDGGEARDALAAIAGELDGGGEPPSPRRRWARLATLVSAGAALGAAVSLVVLRPPAPAYGADGRITVAVADVANETSDPDLDGLSGLLVTSLEQSHKVRVVTRSRMVEVLRRLGKDGAARIDERLARAVAAETGARALLLATVRRFDDTYELDLRALDPARDADLFAAGERAVGKRSVPELVDRVTARTRLAFEEQEREVAAPSTRASVVAPDLSAYAHYARGVELADRYLDVEAASELREALRLDPGLAMAHYELSVLGVPGADGHIEEADRLSERLPEKERALVKAARMLATLDGRKALPMYDELVRRFPDDKRVAYAAALAHAAVGDVPRGVDLFEAALRLDPAWIRPLPALARFAPPARFEPLLRESVRVRPTADSLSLLANFLRARGDLDGALDAARRYVAASGGVDERGALGRVLVAREELDEAERVLRAAAGHGAASTGRQVELAAVLTMKGRWTEAREALTEAEGSAVRQDAVRAREELEAGFPPSPALSWLAHVARDPSFRETGALSLALGREISPEHARAVVALALSGDHASAARVLGDLTAVFGQLGIALLDPAPYQALVEGVRARARRDRAAERRAFARVAELRPLLGHYVLGEACFEQRDDACAVEELEAFLRTQELGVHPAWRAWAHGRALCHLALARERRGEVAEARRTVGRLLALWKDAEPGTPQLEEARALQRRHGEGI